MPTGCAVSADGRRLYFGSYRGGLYRARPVMPTDARRAARSRIAGIDASVIDVSRGPDGTIYVATTDSILRLAGTPSGSPVPVGAPRLRVSERGGWTGAGLVIAAVLIGWLILLRRRIVRR